MPGCIRKMYRPARIVSKYGIAHTITPVTRSSSPVERNPRTKLGPALMPTAARNPLSPRESNNQMTGSGTLPNRGRIECSQPMTNEARSTPTGRPSPIVSPAACIVGKPSSPPIPIARQSHTRSVACDARSTGPSRPATRSTCRFAPINVSTSPRSSTTFDPSGVQSKIWLGIENALRVLHSLHKHSLRRELTLDFGDAVAIHLLRHFISPHHKLLVG